MSLEIRANPAVGPVGHDIKYLTWIWASETWRVLCHVVPCVRVLRLLTVTINERRASQDRKSVV